jgi:hypothetical protein
MEELRYSSTIFGRSARWRWVVSFSPRPLYCQGKSPRYPLDRRLGGPQSRSERNGEEKEVASAGIRIPVVYPVARRYTDWAVPPAVFAVLELLQYLPVFM